MKRQLFLYFFILTFFLFLIEISLLIVDSTIYFGDFKLIANHLAVPWRVAPGILYFIVAQLITHVGFVVLIWTMTLLAAIPFSCHSKTIERGGTVLWSIALLAVLFANRVYFPNSKFSNMLLDTMPLATAKIIYFVLLALLGISFLFALTGLVIWVYRQSQFIRGMIVTGILISTIMLGFHPKTILQDGGTIERPNIILIGVDSLRPDFLGFFGYAPLSPHMDNFLNQATVFSESLTPLARTFPSWVSILTGRYPILNSIRTNLEDPAHLDFSTTLSSILQKQGYQTIFATDETRFSNIDTHYGFDKTITPPIGFNDFLLGTLNDFPFSNLLVNTWMGHYLFPNSYANRSLFVTYQPHSFIDDLRSHLLQSRTQPLFLIVHFCLPHFPYAWADLPVKKVSVRHYQASIHRVDQQFASFMQLLEQAQLLQHSIVVLLSDHGEAVEIPGDRITDPELFIAGKKNLKKQIPHFYPPSSAREKVNMSGGHGTDVLGLSQYHTVLAFKTYGLKPNRAQVVTGMVSVMDIKPTILEYLHLAPIALSGTSLLDYIFSARQSIAKHQDFFTESDFSPEAVRSIHPEERKVLFEGIDYFQINAHTTRVVVRESMLKMILASKQYADFYDQWVLALYPRDKDTRIPILVNLETGQWTDDLSTPFAQHSPAQRMLKALRRQFGVR